MQISSLIILLQTTNDPAAAVSHVPPVGGAPTAAAMPNVPTNAPEAARRVSRRAGRADQAYGWQYGNRRERHILGLSHTEPTDLGGVPWTGAER